MSAELTYQERDREIRDAHRRWLLSQHHAVKAFGPIVDDPVIEVEFSQSFDDDDADGVL